MPKSERPQEQLSTPYQKVWNEINPENNNLTKSEFVQGGVRNILKQHLIIDHKTADQFAKRWSEEHNQQPKLDDYLHAGVVSPTLFTLAEGALARSVLKRKDQFSVDAQKRLPSGSYDITKNTPEESIITYTSANGSKVEYSSSEIQNEVLGEGSLTDLYRSFTEEFLNERAVLGVSKEELLALLPDFVDSLDEIPSGVENSIQTALKARGEQITPQRIQQELIQRLRILDNLDLLGENARMDEFASGQEERIAQAKEEVAIKKKERENDQLRRRQQAEDRAQILAEKSKATASDQNPPLGQYGEFAGTRDLSLNEQRLPEGYSLEEEKKKKPGFFKRLFGKKD